MSCTNASSTNEPGSNSLSATTILKNNSLFSEQEKLHRDARWATQLSGFRGDHPDRPHISMGRAGYWLDHLELQSTTDGAMFTPKIADGSSAGLCLFRPMTGGTPGFVSTGYMASFMDNVFGTNNSTHHMGGVTLRLECNFDYPVPMLVQQNEVSSDQVKSVGFIPDFNAQITKVEGRKVFTSGSMNGPRITNRVLLPDGSQLLTQPEQVQYAHCSALFFDQTSSKRQVESRTSPLVFPPNMIEQSVASTGMFIGMLSRILEGYSDDLKENGQNYPVCQSDVVAAWKSHEASRQMFVPVSWVDAMEMNNDQWQHVTDQVYDRTPAPFSTGPPSCHIVRNNAALRPKYFSCRLTPFEFDAVYQATCWTMGPPGSVHGGCSLTIHEDSVHAFVLLYGDMLVTYASCDFSCDGMAGTPSASHISKSAVVIHTKHIAINYRKMTPMDRTYRVHVKCTGFAPMSTKETPVLAFSTELRSGPDAETPDLLHTDGIVHVAVSLAATVAAL